jgi:hypothetical protein
VKAFLVGTYGIVTDDFWWGGRLTWTGLPEVQFAKPPILS